MEEESCGKLLLLLRLSYRITAVMAGLQYKSCCNIQQDKVAEETEESPNSCSKGALDPLDVVVPQRIVMECCLQTFLALQHKTLTLLLT